MGTKTEKFGSLIGDNSKIGATAVLSLGTILEKKSIVKRFELIEPHKMTKSRTRRKPSGLALLGRDKLGISF